ncbi:hypothetical protein Lal_00031483 [Lupinus albus]|nr:hypothetical protein Lal_00031483 [Lupinus albus]
MEEGRTKRVKTSATRVRRREVGSPSTRDCGDPYYSIILQETRMAKFQGRKPTYIRIGDCSWVKENFDPTEVYKSFLRGPHLYIQGQLTKAGSLSVENRLLHYIIAYILVQRNTNHAQPTVNDLRFIRSCFPTVSSSHALLIICALTFPIPSLLNTLIRIIWLVKAIHKMGIYKYGTTWKYLEDYTTIGLDLSNDDNQDDRGNQHATTQGEPSGSAPQNSAFGLDQLEAMEQRLNNRMDLHFQGLKESYFAGMEQYEERQTAYSNNQFQELRNLIQSTADAQNALFCSDFQKLSVLIRGDQNIVIPADHTDDPHPPPQP